MTRYVLSEDGNLCAPNDATEDADLLIDWDEFYAMRQRAETAENTHQWFQHPRLDWPSCRLCGIVKRADGKNSACRGKINVKLRVSQFDGELNGCK